jgi:uncharacterized protein (DUF488 family)
LLAVVARIESVGHDEAMLAGRIYSVGYEGMTLNGLVEMCRQNRITAVVDVRLTAASRRPGFAKRALAAGLEAAGISYLHEARLGNPPENRDAFRSGDADSLDAGRRVMAARLRNGSGEALLRLVELARADRVAVLCVERDAERCHRQVITDAVVAACPTIEVIPVRT